MSRVFAGSGVYVASVASIGFAGACETPLLVTNAKLKGSMPTLAAPVAFCVVPATGSSSRLKMFSAAHHLVGSQVPAPAATAHVGHPIHPGGENCSSMNAVPGWLGETAGSTMLRSLSGVHVETCSG